MKRKLVRQGVRALTITLPSTWIKANDLKAGDEVNVAEIDDVINITTEKKQPMKEIMVDVSGLLPRLADRFMARSYQKGYDKITIKYDDPELMLAVKNKIPELMGFEILNMEKDRMDIQVISTDLDLNFDIMLRRAFIILLDMGTTCHDAWKKEDKRDLENIYYQDYDVNKFTYFCLRELNKSQKLMSFGRSIIYYLIESMEDLGDELKVLGKLLAEIKPNKKILEIIAKLNKLFRISYEYFYSPEKQKAVDAFTLYKEISKMIDEVLVSRDKNLIKALISIDFSSRIIYHLTTMRLDTLKELSGDQK